MGPVSTLLPPLFPRWYASYSLAMRSTERDRVERRGVWNLGVQQVTIGDTRCPTTNRIRSDKIVLVRGRAPTPFPDDRRHSSEAWASARAPTAQPSSSHDGNPS